WATYVTEGDPDRPRGRPRLRSAEGSPPGEVALLAFPGEISEAEGIAKLIQKLTEPGENSMLPSEILVLLRSDYRESFSNPIKQALEDLHIPYSDPASVERILGEPNNRRVLEIFRLLVNPSDSLAWAGLL